MSTKPKRAFLSNHDGPVYTFTVYSGPTFAHTETLKIHRAGKSSARLRSVDVVSGKTFLDKEFTDLHDEFWIEACLALAGYKYEVVG